MSSYTDSLTTTFVPGVLPFTVGDRLDFTAVVSEFSAAGSQGLRIRFRINGTYVGLPTSARVTAPGTGTYTGNYTVASGLTGIGTSIDHSAQSSLNSISVTCTPYIDTNLSLGVSMSHAGTPQQGGTVDYTITPSASGAGTGSNLTLSFTLPSGMTYNSGSGSGWSCTSTRCIYSSTIANGASGNPLTLRVNIAANAATSLTPSVTLSGGNAPSSATASDPTTIAVVQTPATVTIAGGNSQSAVTGAAFATPLTVTVRDGSNAVIANTPVTFAAPASGASGTFSNSSNSITVNTDASGVASAGSFTANGTAGAYSVTATAGSVSANFSLTNIAAPTVTGIAPTAGPTTGGTSVVITGTGFTGATAVSFGSAPATFVVDSPTQITATSPAASAGTVNITVTGPGGTSATSAADQFSYEAAPAPPTLTATPPALTNSASATFQFSLSGGTAQCSLDGGAFTACTSPRTYAGLADGSHNLQVRATSAGGTSTSTTYSWTIDTMAPSAPVVTNPSNGSDRVVSNRTIEGAGEAGATITVYLDGSADGTTTADGSGNWTYTLAALSAGAHAIKARAADAAGNSSGDSLTRSFTAYSELTASQPITSITATANVSTFSALKPVVPSGGKTPYTYAISGATLPTGVTFDTSAGTLSGTPTTVLTATDFTITASDALGQTQTRTLRLTVNSDRAQYMLFTSTAPSGAVVGGATYTPVALASSGLTVTLTIDPSSSAVCSLAGGTVSFTGVGTCTINANQAGNASWDPAPQLQQSFAVGQGTQTIAFTSTVPSAAAVGGTYTPAATATSGLAVAFAIDASSAGVCTLAGGTVSFVAVGTCRINADQPGDANYAAAAQAQQSFAVAKGDQTISFAALSDQPITVSTVTLAATAGSGLPVSFASSTPGVCSVSGTTLSLIAQGQCTVTADQSGDATWNAAPTVTHSFTVLPPALAVSSGAPALAKVGAAFTQANDASGGVPGYSYAVAAGALPAGTTLDSGTGTVTGIPTAAGAFSYTIRATDSGSPAATANGTSVSGTILKGDQALSFTSSSPGTVVPGGPAYTIAATSTAGLTPSFAIDASSTGICTISGAAVSFTAAGTCIVTASQAGDANYNAASPISQSLTVLGAPVAADLANVAIPFASSGTAIDLSASISGGPHNGIAIAAAPAHGSVSIAGDVVTYTPASGYFGADSFTYTATGPAGSSAPATVGVVVATPPAPVAGALSDVAVAYDSPGTAIDLSGAVSGVASTLAAVTAPQHGTVSFAGTTATYIPTPGYFGADSFTYAATGPGGTSPPAAVGVVVATPPAPVAGALADVAVAYDSPGTAIDLSGAVSGVSSTLVVASPPQHGTVSVAGTTATYIPTPGYFGADSFTYTATGPGGTSQPAAVGVVVAPPPAPVAGALSDVAIAYDSPGTAIDLGASVTGIVSAVGVVIEPQHGTVSIAGPIATYIPQAGYFGADSFTYTATGPGGTSQPATVALVVAMPPPPVAEETSETLPAATETNAGSQVTIDLTSLVSGVYTDVQITRQPQHGTVRIERTIAAAAGARRALAAPAILAIYQPDPGYAGPDSFAWVAIGPGGTSAPAEVGITVLARMPVLAPRTAAAGDGETVSIELTEGATEGPFTAAGIVGVAPQAAASATITESGSGADRRFRLDITPTARFGGTVVVTYTLSNQFGASAPATVTVSVTARPNPTEDPSIRAISDAQAETARRFARVQAENFMRRNEQLHGGGGGNSFGVQLGSRDGSAGPQQRFSTPEEDALAITARMRGSTVADAGRTDTGYPQAGYREDSRSAARSSTARDAAGVNGASSEGTMPAANDAEEEDGARRIGQLAIWSGGTIEIGTLDRTTGRDKISAGTSGLTAGVDVKLARGLVLGIGGGYGAEISRIGGGAARVRARSGIGAFYGSYTIADSAFADFMLGYGTLDYRTRRTVTETAALARGDRDGDMILAAFSAGIDRNDGGLRWSLYGRGEYMAADLDAYVESGAGRYDLRFDPRSVTSLSGVLGGRAGFVQKTIFGSVTPRLRFEWRHEFADSDPQWLDYADIPGAALYRVDSIRWRRDRFELGFGSGLELGNHWVVDVELGIASGQGERAGRLNARVSKAF